MLSEIMKGLPGVRVERLDLPWQGILPGLTAKRFDYVVTSVTVTKERFALYRFSLPVADATMALMKRKGDGSIMKPQDVWVRRWERRPDPPCFKLPRRCPLHW